jgi:hypothetical protein
MNIQTIDFGDVTEVTFNLKPVTDIILNGEIIWKSASSFGELSSYPQPSEDDQDVEGLENLTGIKSPIS